ncbi:pectinesterase 31-like [Miscanthus floridulus]|uniref:pectinesterase 31-like n=1 Tax=Miscanthus floridulus TaxID=154761 RepID=UPI003458C259
MGDRGVLLVVSPEVAIFGYDGVVSFASVQDAVDAVPLNNQVCTIIRIGPGVHRQLVHIPKTKNFVTLCGSPIKDTVICWDNTTTRIKHTQSSQEIGTGTLNSATIIVEGDDFIAENVIFKNSAPQMSGQAAAVRVMANRCAFYGCRFLGWQETLHLHGGKQLLKNCYIEGNYDFIFGDSTALLEHCHIHCKAAGYITAHGRKSSSEATGFVFFKCVITGNGEAAYMYLGRPWEAFGRVVFAETFMDHCIEPVGWHNWDKPENEQTACFYEYRCSGPGSSISEWVPWCKELFGDEAIPFLIQTFIDPDIENPWLVHSLGTQVPVSASSP